MIVVEINVDGRERDMIPLFQRFVSSRKSDIITGINLKQLQVSDVCTQDGLVGIERKAGDFIPSIFNDQLSKQLKEMKDNFEYTFLFIEYDGIVDLIVDNKGINPKVVAGSLTSILARSNVPILFTGNYSSIKPPLEPHPYYVPLVVRTIEKFYDGKTVIKESAYTPIRRKATKEEIKRAMFINVFPSLGKKKVDNLFNHFGNSFSNIVNASVEEIKEVKGIGDKLARNIKDVLS